MTDELNEKPPETPPGDQSLPEVVTEPVKPAAPEKANARLIELEQAVVSRESEIASLKQAKNELEAELTATSHSLTEAVASYRASVLQVNPEVIRELITGDTIEAVNDSLKKAKTLVSRVRQGVEAEISLAKVPAGAPERTSPDLSALSPREKIQYAIGNRK